MPSMFEELGGESALRAVISGFVARVFADPMIGFFFRNSGRKRIEELEYQHAAEFLGAAIVYRGRPLDEAHRAHPIMGGQFARRMQILREVLDEHGVPSGIRDAWLAHNESLRQLITRDAGSACDLDQALKPT